MSQQSKHTPGFCRILKWDADLEKAHLRMGYVREDAPDNAFTFATWVDLRSEADAREFVRRWNAHERLVAALQRVWDYYDHGSLNDFKGVMRQLSEAIDSAKGGAAS